MTRAHWENNLGLAYNTIREPCNIRGCYCVTKRVIICAENKIPSYFKHLSGGCFATPLRNLCCYLYLSLMLHTSRRSWKENIRNFISTLYAPCIVFLRNLFLLTLRARILLTFDSSECNCALCSGIQNGKLQVCGLFASGMRKKMVYLLNQDFFQNNNWLGVFLCFCFFFFLMESFNYFLSIFLFFVASPVVFSKFSFWTRPKRVVIK